MTRRKLSALSLALLTFGWSAACSQLVGITDTEVTSSSAGSAATSGGESAKAGTASSSGGATANAGTAQGGRAGGSNAAGASNGGNGAGAGGKGGAPASAGEASGGEGGASGCTNDEQRCGASGHERCVGGVWQDDACPANLPTCVAKACAVRGPTMANVGTYYVDSTEVTVGQYKQFLTAKAGDISGQPSICAWNTSFYAAAATPLEADDLPIAWVDWCDATAFCSWADKRLCGAIGAGAITKTDFADQTKSQWYRACAGEQGASHPSNTDECNSNGGFDDVAPVATFPGCEGRTPGAFDLEGNVAEWIDSCDGATGKDDHCLLAGGNIIDQQSYCDETYADVARNSTAYTFGFRCCSK